MGVRDVTQQRMAQLAGKAPPRPHLGPNELELFSYYKPGLLAGNYKIETEQNITVTEGPYKKEKLRVYNRKKTTIELKDEPVAPAQELIPQTFEVIAPQFTLNPKLINTFYPPQGHQDEGRVLPHLVLNDPHFPWERKVDFKVPLLWDEDKSGPEEVGELDRDGKEVTWLDAKGNAVKKKTDAAKRNAVPWVAIMVFDADELAPLTTKEVTKEVLNIEKVVVIEEQPKTGAIPMTVKQYLSIPPSSRVNFEAGRASGITALKESQEMMTAIFPTKSKFLELFPDIPSLRYSAHVRNINTVGFPDAGIEQDGLYSIMVSSRVGKYNIEKPTTQIVHLISLEHLESTKIEIKKETEPHYDIDRIGLVSLHSWTYTALPPDPVNFVDSINKVVNELQMLRPKDETLAALGKKIEATTDATEKAGLEALNQRLSAGYSLARWRCETGEETVAFSRGPLVPQLVPKPPADWATSSNTSKEYQILDKKTGIMDLSYSSAWQLGKTLAISDSTFSQALARLRSTIQRSSQSKTRAEVNSVSSKSSLIAAMKDDIKTMTQLSSGDVSVPRRITMPASNTLAPALDDASVAPVFDKNLVAAVETAGSSGSKIYNGFNTEGHNNTDWTIIHTWISEKLYLSDIPAHILITDPTFLPMESIRFFHIDDTWLDCLIDGALSVGNHLERDDDRIRQGIKQTYNKYLADKSLGIRPQIPAYGFYLRSQIVKVMPDLKITIKWKTKDDRYPFCRYTRPEDQTILCLLDRPPEELELIELAQPGHQQRFTFGSGIKNGKFQFSLRKLYTTGDNKDMRNWGSLGDDLQPEPSKISSWFAMSEAKVNDVVPTPRVINFGLMASDVHNAVRANAIRNPRTNPPTFQYNDFVANSAELALELNDPSYFFEIKPFGGGNKEVTQRNRQLHCQEFILAEDSTIAKPKDNPKDSDPIGGALAPTTPDTSIPIDPIRPQPPTKANHIIVSKKSAVPVSPGTNLKASLPAQCFEVKIYADFKGPSAPVNLGRYAPGDFIPSRNEYLYDLIFSVRKSKARFKADYKLREIIFNIPTSALAGATEPLINAGVVGPKVRMLSNQRFVPFLNWAEGFLQVRLVPRSASDHPMIVMNDNKTKEISFRLQEVEVPEIRTKVGIPIIDQKDKVERGLAEVFVYERYATDADDVTGGGSPRIIKVVKKDDPKPKS